MADYTELKRLAEACGDLNWRAIQENWCEWAIRDDHGYIAVMRTKSAKHPGPCSDREAKAKFLCAMTPAAVLALIAENELARMRIKELDLLFGRYILAMRSALIEEEHGKGPAAAMEWIYNSLAGPGELPPEGETGSQAYFDREIVAVDDGMQAVMAFHEARRAAMGKGEQQ